jgi:DNA topoisomerase-2
MDEEAIMREFFALREALYHRRKDYLLAKLRKEWETIENKVRFILAIINGEIQINRVKKRVIVNTLKQMHFKTASEINEILPEKKRVTIRQDSQDGEEEEEAKA